MRVASAFFFLENTCFVTNFVFESTIVMASVSSGEGRDEMVSDSLKGLSSGADSEDEDSDNNEVVVGGYTHTHKKKKLPHFNCVFIQKDIEKQIESKKRKPGKIGANREIPLWSCCCSYFTSSELKNNNRSFFRL